VNRIFLEWEKNTSFSISGLKKIGNSGGEEGLSIFGICGAWG